MKTGKTSSGSKVAVKKTKIKTKQKAVWEQHMRRTNLSNTHENEWVNAKYAPLKIGKYNFSFFFLPTFMWPWKSTKVTKPSTSHFFFFLTCTSHLPSPPLQSLTKVMHTFVNDVDFTEELNPHWPKTQNRAVCLWRQTVSGKGGGERDFFN